MLDTSFTLALFVSISCQHKWNHCENLNLCSVVAAALVVLPVKSLEIPLNVLHFQKPQVFLSLPAHPAIMSGGHSLLLITLSLSTR